MKVHYRDRALADLDEIFQYIDKRGPGGARNVIDAIHAAIQSIAAFPLSAFYRIDAGAIDILDVRHGARRPWEER
jgi:toxin ParE1/3/4